MPETQTERRTRQRQEEKAEEVFARQHNAASSFGQALRGLARQIARIIESFAPRAEGETLSPGDQQRLEAALRAYSRAIHPWARATSWRMVSEVNRRNKTAWEKHTRGMSQALRREIMQAPIGETMLGLMEQQVGLITSLPIEAAQRVHEKTQEAIIAGTRYSEKTWLELGEGRRALPARSELVEALAAANPEATEAWLRNRATLIARTETARTASTLVQARAEHIGAEQYQWMTAGDWKVRESHRKLNRSVHRWDTPPLSDPPDHYSHPGQIWNCRCTAIPIIA